MSEELDGLQKQIQDAATKLGEHFDSVIIIATAGEGGESTNHFTGASGNGAASRGAAESYIDQQRGFEFEAGRRRYIAFNNLE